MKFATLKIFVLVVDISLFLMYNESCFELSKEILEDNSKVKSVERVNCYEDKDIASEQYIFPEKDNKGEYKGFYVLLKLNF